MDATTSAGLIVGIVLIALVRSKKNTDLLIWAGVIAMTIVPYQDSEGKIQTGILSIGEAFAALTNEGVIAIAALFIVAAGVKETGFLGALLEASFKRRRKREVTERFKMFGMTSLVSAFFNNTPLMAILVPTISQSSKKHGLSPSHILMPLSFAAIFGGSCTLIGTNTNLMINAWLIDTVNHKGFGIFEITPIMLPSALLALVGLIYFSPKILPERLPVFRRLGDLSEHTIEMLVGEQSTMIGLTVEDAGLRGLDSLYLIEIIRRGQTLAAVSGNIVLESNDILCFVGAVSSTSELKHFDGLREPDKRLFDFSEKANRRFLEVVISTSSSLVGKSVKDSRFRTAFSAAILAVARNGEHLKGKIGNIVLQEGDTLLLEARRNLPREISGGKDFFIVSESKTIAPKFCASSFLALGIVLGMIIVVTLEFVTLVTAALVSSAAMLFFKCCSLENARKAIDWQVILTIGGTLALGKAMAASGLAELISESFLIFVPRGDIYHLIAFFLLSSLASNIISSKAGALFVLPIAASTAELLGVSLLPFVFSIMVGSSMAVSSPLTYPSNLMVYGPGGYVFQDYLRLGLPITIITGTVGIVMINILVPF